MPTRNDIVSKAREYVGTPYHHGGRIKGVGIDGTGLILCVANELGLTDGDGVAFLSSDFDGVNPRSGFLQSLLAARLKRKLANAFLPGDILYLQVPGVWSLGIATELHDGVPSVVRVESRWPSRVVEHVMDPAARRAASVVFGFPGVQ